MTRTKALLVVGCIMLALAVLAALELRQETVEPSGQIVTGLINKTDPPAQTLAEAPRPGALVPLDQGTLRPDESVPAALPGQTAVPAEAAPENIAPANPAPANPEPVAVESVNPEPVNTEPVKPEPVKPEPARAESVKPAPVPAPAAKEPEQTKPEPVKPEAAKSEPSSDKNDKADKDDKTGKAEAVRAIDTAGPVKVEKGQNAIVWTRLELSEKSALFRLSGAEKVEGKAFALPDPDRYVVDLQGDWAMRLPAVPKNAFIKKIRVGKFGDNTRMVLDLSGAHNCQMVRINPTTLEFRIR